MQKFIQPGATLTATAAAATTVGHITIINNLIGVAAASVALGETVEVHVEGVYRLPKATGAVNQGATLYWSTANNNVTTTATSNTKIGYATEAALSGDTEINVKLIPAA